MRALLPLLLLTLFCTCAPAPEKATAQEAAPTVYEDLSPAEFAERIGAENAVLIDVRTPGEIAKGKIDGALEMDYRAPNFASQLEQLDPNKTYLIYCASGGRSGKTCGMLNDAGFANVYNLKGGYSAWKQQ
ncbi:MAG: rhodanese-like domain-containing protein [Bacteroidota bacterium]